jgi:hypothetical protein
MQHKGGLLFMEVKSGGKKRKSTAAITIGSAVRV